MSLWKSQPTTPRISACALRYAVMETEQQSPGLLEEK
jgi:hypothetical protein